MNNENTYYADLALGLLQGTLSAKEKSIAQELIVNSETFQRILREEIVLKKKMEELRTSIPPKLYERLYGEITANTEQIVFNRIFSVLLDLTLPEVLQPLSKLFQRSVLVNG